MQTAFTAFMAVSFLWLWVYCCWKALTIKLEEEENDRRS